MTAEEENYTPRCPPKDISMKCCTFKGTVFHEIKEKFHNYEYTIENCSWPLISIEAKDLFTNIR